MAGAIGPSGSAGEDTPAFDLDDAVESLGISNFPTQFAGDALSSSGNLVVYVDGQVPSTLAAQIQAVNPTDIAVSFDQVPQSYSELTGLVSRFSSMIMSLYDSSGINVEATVPDPATGNVNVTLYSPTPSELTTFNSVSGNTAATTDSSYASQVQAYLDSTISSFISVVPTYGDGEPSGRLNDSSPFTGGDSIYRPITSTTGEGCTSGFAVTGNNSGNVFTLTAGHCGDGPFYDFSEPPGEAGTEGNELGATTTNGNYMSSDEDVQTLSGASYAALVWSGPPSGDTSFYYVSAAFENPVGSTTTLTTDGAVTGEVNDVEVIANGATFSDASENIVDDDCLEMNLTNGNSNADEPGDSGGPVFQRLGDEDVKAAGIIEGEDTASSHLFVTEISEIQTITTSTVLIF